jgi:hypothetical protein
LKKLVADAGYGSESNYDFMERNDIEPYVKFPMFHKEQKKSFKDNGFLAQNLFYNKEKDFFVCPMGQHMEKVGEGSRTSEGGHVSFVSYYEAKNCKGCPLKYLCHKAEGNRRIEVNLNLNRHKERVRKLLTSEEGLYHRSHRPIEPESVFGQVKSNKGYNRFRHFNKDTAKVMMDFAILAIAFNIGKLHNKGKNAPQNASKSLVLSKLLFFVVFFDTKSAPCCFYPQNLKLAA